MKTSPLCMTWRVCICAALIYACASVGIAIADVSSQEPVAYAPEPIYQFEPVIEGTIVAHPFVLRNRGNQSVRILDVRTG